MSSFNLAFAPLVPWQMLVALAGMGLVVVALGVYARRRGALLRALGLALVLVALADPSLVREDRQPLKDVVAVVLDRSGSQTIGERRAQTDKARAEIAKAARRARQYRDALRRRRHRRQPTGRICSPR